jgi:fructose-bisphosphate aldolase class I
MDRNIEGQPTADYLWNVKRIVPFLKVDKACRGKRRRPADEADARARRAAGRATAKRIFGTKMRSFIKQANGSGIRSIVTQQFESARQIIARPGADRRAEVDIHSPEKAKPKNCSRRPSSKSSAAAADQLVMLKLTLPEKDDLYAELVKHPRVVRVVALSGGYSREEGNRRLRRNHGVVASFSRALVEGLSAQQSDAEYNAMLDTSIQSIFEASNT